MKRSSLRIPPGASRLGTLFLPLRWIWRGCFAWDAAWMCVRLSVAPQGEEGGAS